MAGKDEVCRSQISAKSVLVGRGLLLKCALAVCLLVYDRTGTIMITDMVLEHILYTWSDVKTCCL